MKGEIHTYQDMNNQSEKVHIMLKDFTYGFMLTNIENFAKVTKIGTLDMKGEIHTYQDMNNQSEKVHIMLKDFTYGFMLTNIENFAKVTLQ